jgi:ribosomal protein L7Ae-like RNA K-turn-binding protein
VDSSNLSFIGLAQKAGKTLTGTAACEKGLKRGSIKLLLLQDGLSASTVDKFTYICRKNNVDVLVVNSYYRLGLAIGKEGIMIIGITDTGFADSIRKNIFGGQGSGFNEQIKNHRS